MPSNNPPAPPGAPSVARLNPAALERTRALFRQRQLMSSGDGAIPLTWSNRPDLGFGGSVPMPIPQTTPVSRLIGPTQSRIQTAMSPAAAARALPGARLPPPGPGLPRLVAPNGGPVILVQPQSMTGRSGSTPGAGSVPAISTATTAPPGPTSASAPVTPIEAGGPAGRRRRPNMTLSDLKASPAAVPTARPQLNGHGAAAELVAGAMANRPPFGGGLRVGSDAFLSKSGAFASASPPSVADLVDASNVDAYANVLDPHKGTLRFGDRAVLDSTGVRFAGGHTFRISLDAVELLQELGRGNYGTVFKVIRCRRRSPRKPNTGLAGTRQRPLIRDASDLETIGGADGYLAMLAEFADRSRLMAMKEIRLELDPGRLGAIITELDILNRCMSPHIVDFFGAFFQESAVYICMEYMDGGSVEKLYDPSGIPEPVLAKIALAAVEGLRYLKNDHNIIHRDIKPTNILTNTRGQVKICDFGVSGNLVGSLATTNVGCQSYMAPERIAGPRAAALTGSRATYNTRSDIWSLGLTIVECALGRYPYPTDVYGQLEAIVSDRPPSLPTYFSAMSQDFIASCLQKKPALRPSYDELASHPWLAAARTAVGPTATFDPELDPAVLAERRANLAEAQNAPPRGPKRGGLPPELIAAADAVLDQEDPERYPIMDRDIANWVRRGIRRRRARLRAQGIVVEE